MYVCMYVCMCMHVYIYICIYIYIHIYMYVYAHICEYLYLSICYTRMYLSSCIWVFMYSCAFLLLFDFMYVLFTLLSVLFGICVHECSFVDHPKPNTLSTATCEATASGKHLLPDLQLPMNLSEDPRP